MIEQARENVLVLQQGARLLRRIDDQIYRCHLETMNVNTVGAHVRHNLDHYLSFIVGLGSGIIDYEAREREKVFEIDRQAALAATEAICGHLVDLTESPCAKSLRICCNSDQGTLHATSSITRELDFLLSHTIHHYAIIAVLCRLQNVEVEPDFGVAPSTLRYQSTSIMQCATND